MTDKLHYDFDLRLDDLVSTHAIQFRLVPPNSKVLDVGCHTGILAEALRVQKQCVVTGIDNDEAALGIARARLDDVRNVDLEREGWSSAIDTRFDVLLFGDVIEHTRNPLAILREGRSLLKSGGRMIVSLPNVANLRVRLGLLFGKFEYADSGILDESHLRFFTVRTARKLVWDAGYEILSETYSGYSLPRWLIDRFPSIFAVNIILVAKPR
jgi:methionine biosynthesis protein MetW